MSRRPNVSQALAMKAAAAAAREVEQDDADASLAPASLPKAASQPAPLVEDPQPAEAAMAETRVKLAGRPKGRRPVAARQTVYLDDARHAALARIAEDRGRSIHSLILEGIDHVIGKPTTQGWQ